MYQTYWSHISFKFETIDKQPYDYVVHPLGFW
jgi:hypothetical protein